MPVEAENQGKIVITTELGGGGRVPEPVHRLAWSGLNNVLRHVGLLEGEVETRASLGLPDAVIIDGRDPTNYVIAEEAGPVRGAEGAGRDGRAAASRSAASGSPTSSAATPSRSSLRATASSRASGRCR